jgi:hypothetical protein
VTAADYRARAETFTSEIGLEHYLHYAGLQESYEIEAIYDRHGELFTREAVEALRDGGAPRALVEFAVHGLIGRATAPAAAELARREATLELEVEPGEERIPFRQAPVVQANEPDPERRAAIHAARLDATERELQPLLREAHEETAALAAELGWPSVVALCEDLSGVELRALGPQVEEVLDATRDTYGPLVEPELREHLGFGFERLRASDLPAFFRAPRLDAGFPAERLVAALETTAEALGFPLAGLPNVHLDVAERRTKSPRAFCSPVRVPDEVYLVLAPTGGRDDYATLMHEAGHALHFGHADRALPFEDRHLGDYAVTEGWAFLLQYLTADPEWLRRRVGLAEPEPVVRHARAETLVFLRRYCAKHRYELELHGEGARLDAMPERYAGLLSDAVRVDWPRTSWLSDVDPFFYVAAYLRAWALQAHLRRHLAERFGPAWFERREAGEVLRSLWAQGQRPRPDELLAEATGRELDFSALLEELAAP